MAMTTRWGHNETAGGHAAYSEIVEWTGLSESNVRLAITDLRKRNILATRAGNPRTPTTYFLTFTRVKPMRVPGPGTLNPPPELFQAPSLPTPGTLNPQSELFQAPCLPGPGTLTEENTEPRARVDIDFDKELPIIDRVLRAKPTKDTPAAVEIRKWLHGYQAKFGQDRHPHPPDAKILAQLLVIVEDAGGIPEPSRLVRLLQDLMAERKQPGDSYSWYVTVALQRIHGINPGAVKARRAQLRIVHGQRTTQPDPDSRPAPPPTRPAPPDFADLFAELAPPPPPPDASAIEYAAAELLGQPDPDQPTAPPPDPDRCIWCNGSGYCGSGSSRSKCGGCFGSGRTKARP